MEGMSREELKKELEYIVKRKQLKVVLYELSGICVGCPFREVVCQRADNEIRSCNAFDLLTKIVCDKFDVEYMIGKESILEAYERALKNIEKALKGLNDIREVVKKYESEWSDDGN